MKLKKIALFASAMLLVACTGLSKVDSHGHTTNPVWPKAENQANSTWTNGTYSTKEGSWPHIDDVKKLRAGMNKYQIQHLVGAPHFAAGIGVATKEWDYLFNFDVHGEHRTCQFKVLFDKNLIAQTLLWHPSKCYE